MKKYLSNIIILIIAISALAFNAYSADIEKIPQDDCITLYNGGFLVYNSCEEDSIGASVTTILATDKLKDSRAVINANFANLNNNKLENSDFTGSTGITYTSTGTIAFDCSEVEGTGINCVGEAITLDNTGSWAGTIPLSHTNIFVGNASNEATATSTITISSDGNVGIGTTSPCNKLCVNGPIRTTDTFYGNTWASFDDNSMSIQPTGDEDDFFSFKTPSHRPTIKREGGKYIYIESSNVNDVGISFRKDADHSGTVNYYKDTEEFGLTSKDPLVFKVCGDYDDYLTICNANSIPELSVASSSGLKINAGGTNPLMLNHDGGNVGIGTDNPGDTLQISQADTGGIHIKTHTTTDARARMIIDAITVNGRGEFQIKGLHNGFDGTQNADGGTIFSMIQDSGAANPQTFTWTTFNNGLKLDVANNGSGGTLTGVLTIRDDGKVGIGTTSPTHLLEVDGNGYFDGTLETTGALNVKTGANPGFTVGDGTNGYFYLGDALLKKQLNNFFSFNNDGVQGIKYLTIGQDSPTTDKPVYIQNAIGDSNVIVTIRARASQTGNLTVWEDSGGNDLIVIDANGNFNVSGTATTTNLEVTNNTTLATATIENLTATNMNIGTLNISNSTTDNTITIDQNGNVGTDVSADGAIHIENTDNTGIGFSVYSNMNGDAAAALVNLKADSNVFDEEVLRINNDGTGSAFYTYQAGTPADWKGTWYLEHPGVLAGNKFGLRIYSNSAHTGGYLSHIRNDGATNAAVTLGVINDGTAPALEIDANNGTHINLLGDTSNSSPADGDIWFDGTNLKIRIGATTYNLDKTAE